MSENVKCPACGKQAQWLGCAGCGDDMGTVVCRACGATMPGIPLSELARPTQVEQEHKASRCDVRG
jgi:transcription elongation factor Elf1